MITKEQVLKAQDQWGAGVVKIGSLKEKRAECEEFTSEFIDTLYSFEKGPVLFKPTKCAIQQFRSTKAEAQSYHSWKKRAVKKMFRNCPLQSTFWEF